MSPSGNELFRFDEFALNRLTRTLVRGGVPVALSPKAFEVLTYLVLHPGRVVTKQELLKAVWPESFVEEGNLTQHISVLRKALADRAGCIVTVPGQGYQFTATVHDESALRQLAAVAAAAQSSALLPPETAPSPPRRSFSALLARLVPATMPAGLTYPRLMTVLVTVMLIGGTSWYVWHRFYGPVVGLHHEIVLADFDNRTGDEVFDVVLRDALEIDLEQSPLISLVSLAQTRRVLQQMGRQPGERMTPAVAREVCEREGAQAMLSGSIAPLGSTYVIMLSATDCVSGRQLAKLQAQARSRDDVLQSLGDIASQMRHKLGESLRSVQGFDVPIQQATTPSFDALVAYSRGLKVMGNGLPTMEALPFLQRAVQLDPNFAMAYEQIGSVENNSGDPIAAKIAFTKAYELRSPTNAREQFQIDLRYHEYVEGNLDEALKTLQLYTSSYPQDATVWGTMANTYTQMGRYPEAIEAGRRTVSLSPGAVLGYAVLARAYKRAGQFSQAKAVCAKAFAHGLESWHLHSILFQIAFSEQDQAALARESTWDKGKPSETQTLDNSAWAAATQGRLQDAEKLFHQEEDLLQKLGLTNDDHETETELAQADALLGASVEARAIAARVPIGMDAGIPAALGAALAGDVTYAKKVLAKHSTDGSPADTLLRKVDLPKLQAAIDLREGRASSVIPVLEAGRVYELRDYGLPFLRGQAYLDSHRPAEAAAEYQEILANPGVDPISPMYPLAHLGLARADAMQDKARESRAQYEALFSLWSKADVDLPVLRQARSEYSHLPATKP